MNYTDLIQHSLDYIEDNLKADISPGELAEQAGFCDYTAFFRAFKREYGLSPGEYRKIHGDTSHEESPAGRKANPDPGSKLTGH